MSTTNHIASGTVIGTVSGTALTLVVNVGSSDIIKTVVLAALGALVSFCVSLGLKWLAKRIRR